MSGWEEAISPQLTVNSGRRSVPPKLNKTEFKPSFVDCSQWTEAKDICANKKIISLWLRLESTTSVVQLIHIGVKNQKSQRHCF
jgi:hypothetical protein